MPNISSMLVSGTKGAQIFMIISLIGTIAAFGMYSVSSNALLLILLGYFIYGCMGIVVTYHRQLTHNSYTTFPLLT